MRRRPFHSADFKGERRNMTKAEVHDKLTAPRRIKRKIAVTKAQMERLRVMMLPGAIRYDKDSIQTSPQDPMLVFAEKMDELTRQAKDLELLYMNEYKEVEAMAETLDDAHRDVLKLRYLAEYKPVEIAIELNYSESTVYKLKREAIKLLEG
jgi:RNA polymerase sigma factor (sigma-70 family)